MCAQFKNNISRRVQPLQVVPLGLLYAKAEIFTQGKKGSDRVTEYTCCENMQAGTEEKITFCHKKLPCSLSFFFPSRLEPAISCALLSTFCGFLTAGWKGLKFGLKNGPWVMLFSGGEKLKFSDWSKFSFSFFFMESKNTKTQPYFQSQMMD